MTLPLFQIDAFATRAFEGNPAAVCPLEDWLDDAAMQAIAAENNLSETAFFVRESDGFRIRWFTPTTEVDLCGHATLAAAHVLFTELGFECITARFSSRSGPLEVRRNATLLTLDFPADPPIGTVTPAALEHAFGISPQTVLKGSDYIVVFENGTDLTALRPDYDTLRTLDLRGVCITARHDRYDFVSRFFAPNFGIDEDPVTGSAFTQLVPYWAKILGKNTLFAKQVSSRGGELQCEHTGNRVLISGHAVTYLRGEIRV